MRPIVFYPLAAVVLAVALYLVGGWLAANLRSDRSRVQRVFADVERYANSLDAGGVLQYLDPDYSDREGIDYAIARRVLVSYFFNASEARVRLEPRLPDGFSVEGDETDVLVRASAELTLRSGDTVELRGYLRGNDGWYVATLRRHKTFFRASSLRPAHTDEIPQE